MEPTSLPPGQSAIEAFPRFGLLAFAGRFPRETDRIRLQITGDVRRELTIGSELERIARVDQVSDFHCVTTWTRRSLSWSGVRFSDVYEQLIAPLAEPDPGVNFVVLRAQDGAQASLPLADLLAPDVLLADRLDGAALPVAHGAPLRVVAPAHYGYKSVKHLCGIELLTDGAGYRPTGLRLMVHPRARVAHEERGQWVPGRALRYVYRPMIRPVAARFRSAMREREASANAAR